MSRLRNLSFVTFGLVLGIYAGMANAINSSPSPYFVEQPDGTRIQLNIRGDEYLNFETDRRGFTVMRDRGWHVYAKRDAATGRLVSSGLRVGIDNPGKGGLRPGILPTSAAQKARAKAVGAPTRENAASSSGAPLAATATTGSLRNLVVLLRWSDHTGRPVPTTGDIDVLMNSVGGDPTLAPTGSVRDVYLENSYGMLTLDSTVAYWVTVDNTESYYANGNSGLTSLIHGALRYALNVLDADPNFHFRDYDTDGDGQIDAITFLHSGYGAEWGGTDAYGTSYANRIWSHKWSISGGWTSSDGVRVTSYHISPAVWGTSGSNIGRIGVIAHETGHFLGLPDLYDTDGSGEGIGSFGLMANSWGFDGSQKYPPHMNPWSKIQLGWLTSTILDTAGDYSLQAAELGPSVYRIDYGFPSNEYLLIENRQPIGFDGAMPQGGLAIWHIDDTTGYNTEGYPTASGWYGQHYRVALLQADGGYDMEHGRDRGDRYDVWHAGNQYELTQSIDPLEGPFPNTDAYQSNNFIQTGNRIFTIGAAADTMDFSYQIIGQGAPPAAPSTLAAFAASYDQIDLTWSDNADNEIGFHVERHTEGGMFAVVATVGAGVTSYNDTGLSPSTTYYYRVSAYNGAGESGYSNEDWTTTNSPPPPPTAPSGLTASTASDSAIDLTWQDNSLDEDDFQVMRRAQGEQSWSEAAVLAADTIGYQDTGLSPSTTYDYQVFARNGWGESGSNTASATTDDPPAWVDQFADLDVYVAGTVVRDYTATFEADGVEQSVTERQSGGKPSKRHSYLDHQWRFADVRGGLTISLFINAWAPANDEGDDFLFQVSSDGGQSWTTVITLLNGSTAGNQYSGLLPVSDAGTYYVRVVDSDATTGNRALDSVYVDQMFLRTDLDPNDSEPVAPTLLAPVADSPSQVSLSWRDNSGNERGFDILRSEDGSSFASVGTAAVDATSFIDTSVGPNTSYYYRVDAFTASYTSSSNVVSVETPDGIALTATGGKVKGRIVVDLVWEGGSSSDTLDIWRSVDGNPMATIDNVSSNSSSYKDDTGLRKGTFEYQICTPDQAVCSNSATLVF